MTPMTSKTNDETISKIKNTLNDYQPKPLGEQRDSSIILLLLKIDSELHILFQVRGDTIRQPGETSFPGGGIDQGETPLEAALRETREEMGIPEHEIEVWGEIDTSISDQHIVHCFVGYLPNYDLKDLKPNPDEVDHFYTVKLDYFLNNDPEFYTLNLKPIENSAFPFDLIKGGIDYPFYNLSKKLPFYSLPPALKDEVLWGYTANCVHRFTQIIKST